MQLTRSSADEPCSSCSTTSSSPLSSHFSSADATAVNTAAPTRRNNISLPTALPASPSKQHAYDKSSSGVSPKCLAQRLLQQQYPDSFPSAKLDTEVDTTCPNTLVANTLRASFDKLDRPKLDEKSSGYSSDLDKD